MLRAMPVLDDDPATPDALNGLFRDAHEMGRHVQVFVLTVDGSERSHAIDQATLLAVECLAKRQDIESATGSITVLMTGTTAGVVVAQPKGAPTLKVVGEHLVEALAERLGAGAQIAIGMATTAEHPDLVVDDAIAVAMEGLEVASASGSSRAVHSELYELTLATRRRQGTVFPLESVQHLGDDAEIPRPEVRPVAATAAELAVKAEADPPAASAEATPELEPSPERSSEQSSEQSSESGDELYPEDEEFVFGGRGDAIVDPLGEFDDPFAHLASEAYELGADSAAALTNGIAPTGPATARLEQESRAEIERLRLELELARREKAASAAGGTALENQERRIMKLITQLEGAETEIDRLRAEQAGDKGLPSQFKRVQGLDTGEANAPLKRTIIDGVFRANHSKPAPAPTKDAKGTKKSNGS